MQYIITSQPPELKQKLPTTKTPQHNLDNSKNTEKVTFNAHCLKSESVKQSENISPLNSNESED